MPGANQPPSPQAQARLDSARAKLEEHVRGVSDKEERRQQKLMSGQRPVTRFSTQYAIEWGRGQGWKLVDRERYDARLRQHHDCLMGSDALFESDQGLVCVQGAGQYERGPHWQRFLLAGGSGRCQLLMVRFVYLEFVRGDKDPRKLEWWQP